MADLIIPKRCRRVYACLAGHDEPTAYVRRCGKWRNKDLQQVTGSSAADVRMRELVRLNPDQIGSEVIPGSPSSAKQFWLKGRPWAPDPRPTTRRTRADEPATLFSVDGETL